MENTKRKQLSLILANKLKELRVSRGWTLQQLSIEMDEFVTPQSLGLYERGMRMPSVEVVSKLASVFKIDENELTECRAHAILETCMLLGEDTPPAIRNERNMLVHGQLRPQIFQTDESDVPTSPEDAKAKMAIDLLNELVGMLDTLQVVDKEHVKLGGNTVSLPDLVAQLKSVKEDENLKKFAK